MNGAAASGNPLPRLRAAGFPVDRLSPAERAVLAVLGDDEVSTLISVQQRLLDAAPEVEAHSADAIIGGVLF